MKKIPFLLVLAAFLLPFHTLHAEAARHKKKKKKKKHRHHQVTNKTNNPAAAKTYSYELESNDPVNAPNLSIRLSPFYADLYGLNYNLGYTGEADYRFNNRLEFGGFYKGSYLDRFKVAGGSNGNHFGTSGINKPVSAYGFSFMYYFKSDLNVVNEDITLKIKNTGSVQTVYAVRVPAKRLQLFGIRAGYETFNSTVYSEGGNLRFKGTLVTPDTFALVDPFGGGSFSTYMRSDMLTLGICRTRVTDIHVNVERYGHKRTTAITQLYADLLYAPSINYADINVTYTVDTAQNFSSNEVHYTYSVNALTQKNRIGFRLGYSQRTNYKFSALAGYSVELGMRPGPQSGFDAFYLQIKFVMNLSVHAGSTPAEVETTDDE